MGTDKSLMIFNGEPLINYAIKTLKCVCDKVVISSNKDAYSFTGCEVWHDELLIQAPIIGILSSLNKSQTEINLFLSCDMPFITPSLLKLLLKQSDKHNLIIPKHGDNKIEPLCGVYSKKLLPSLEESIRHDKLKMLDFINKVPHCIVDVPFQNSSNYLNIFTNFNCPEDMRM